uniref:Metalloendopeptidase n=1 Tax=Panagrolaimus sp. JU765 TaxID=591449 RepID=A0AC34Q8J8_9BILA
MIRYRYAQQIFIFLCLFVIFVNAALKDDKKSKILRDESLFYDRSIPDYETVLTPADFEMSAHMSESMQFTNDHGDIWDSDGMYNTDKFEGDIANDLSAKTVPLFLNGGPSNSTATNQHNAIRNRRQLWPNGKIPYALSSQYSSYSRSVIASSMQEYSKHTCVEWVPKTNADTDYVYIMPDRGCYSMVGKTGGKQVLSLGNGCIQKGIIIHEMMHAVGFFHEQSRTDRDDFITIMWNNIQPGMQGQFEKYSTATIQSLGTDYDYTSIMHYGPKAFSRNGLPTIVPKHKATIGQRSGFSSVDSHKINTLYGCPSTGGQTTAAPPTQPPAPTYITLPPQPFPPQPTTQRPYPSPPTTGTTLPPPPVIEECRNTRPDCDQLAQQGWCQRNPKWMKDHCPISCGMCKPKPVPECEDLRVDCAELVKRRYCIMAQNFTKTYCAKSCGFCYVPPATEIPDLGPVNRPDKPTAATSGPMVTFWSTLSPEVTTTATPATPAPITVVTTQSCQDRKHFCGHWKKAGFCEGIFMGYMKKNCPKSCGFC